MSISPGISPGATAPLLKPWISQTCPVHLFKSAAKGFSGLVVHEKIHLNVRDLAILTFYYLTLKFFYVSQVVLSTLPPFYRAMLY